MDKEAFFWSSEWSALSLSGVPFSRVQSRDRKLMAACPGPKIKIANIQAKEMSVLGGSFEGCVYWNKLETHFAVLEHVNMVSRALHAKIHWA